MPVEGQRTAGRIVGRVQEMVVDTISEGAEQRSVGVVVDRDREAAAESSDAGDAPAGCQRIRAGDKSLDRQVV